ncbi:peptidylprolyl isomerase [Alkalihalobacillus trypoxylicola]|uniref:peptidylprolyl isomerase n=1 Tax=Alkalihalobacillus trypoxylicola TaxID=519424 RepID=A0A162F557_9BACI|nr:peptidylprolyl isomerase [Alkalihalobacillus trypoxylicola]KYG34815.1 foldase [Alkalihalobacillus trypoxylicola]
MKKNVIYGLSIAVVLIGAILLGITVSGSPNVMASINGEKIKEEDVQNLVMDQYGTEGLETLVTNKVIELEAEKQGVTVSDEEINEEKQRYFDLYGGEEAFEEMLALNGVLMEDIENDITQYLLSRKMIEPSIEITDEDIQAHFDSNKEQYNQQEQVEASHILVGSEEEAEEVIEKLNDGEAFSELAAEYSTDESNKDNGGELGFFGRGEMVEAFDAAVFEMDIDEISDPIETDFGFHVVQVTDKLEAEEAVLEDHKEEVESALLDQKIQAQYNSWLSSVKEEYDIQYF